MHVNEEFQEDDSFHQRVAYELEREGEQFRLTLNTLLDTGSPISFIK